MFCGYVGNNFISEVVLVIGVIDFVVFEFNCIIFGFEFIVEKYMVKMMCFDDVVKKLNVEFV